MAVPVLLLPKSSQNYFLPNEGFLIVQEKEIPSPGEILPGGHHQCSPWEGDFLLSGSRWNSDCFASRVPARYGKDLKLDPDQQQSDPTSMLHHHLPPTSPQPSLYPTPASVRWKGWWKADSGASPSLPPHPISPLVSSLPNWKPSSTPPWSNKVVWVSPLLPLHFQARRQCQPVLHFQWCAVVKAQWEVEHTHPSCPSRTPHLRTCLLKKED